MKTIIFFEDIYDTLDLFTEQLQEAFEKMGYGMFVYHASQQKQSEETLFSLLLQAAGIQNRGYTELTQAEWNRLKDTDLSEKFAVVTFNNLGYNLEIPFSSSDGEVKKGDSGKNNL